MITLTLQEWQDYADWDKFCQVTGVSVWAVAEGYGGTTKTLDAGTAARVGYNLGRHAQVLNKHYWRQSKNVDGLTVCAYCGDTRNEDNKDGECR